MTKLLGPLFSIAAHGTLGDAVTYSQRRTHNHARFQKPQKDYENEARLLQRDKFYVANVLWHSMTQADRDLWAIVANQGYVDI